MADIQDFCFALIPVFMAIGAVPFFTRAPAEYGDSPVPRLMTNATWARAHVVHEHWSTHAVALRDAHRDLGVELPRGAGVGATLVVPRLASESCFGLEPHEVQAVLETVDTVRKMLAAALLPPPDGYSVGFEDGLVAGTNTTHCAVHVVPQYENGVVPRDLRDADPAA